MSGGRDSALDIHWGRGGGRRVPGHPAGLIPELDELRREMEAAGRWPKAGPEGPCKEIGCLLDMAEHLPRCRVCAGWIEHHDEEACWEAKAVLAAARRAAGGRLTMVDVEALDRYPRPHSWTDAPTPEGLKAALERYRLLHTDRIPA